MFFLLLQGRGGAFVKVWDSIVSVSRCWIRGIGKPGVGVRKRLLVLDGYVYACIYRRIMCIERERHTDRKTEREDERERERENKKRNKQER